MQVSISAFNHFHVQRDTVQVVVIGIGTASLRFQGISNAGGPLQRPSVLGLTLSRSRKAGAKATL